MTKIQPVKNLRGYNMSLFEEVRSLSVPKEQVKKLYGDIGIDIFEGKTPTILSEEDIKESKKLINRVKAWWSGMNKFDYEEKDRLRDVILKYAYNKGSGKTEDIEKLFGEEGLSELKVMNIMGYIEI